MKKVKKEQLSIIKDFLIFAVQSIILVFCYKEKIEKIVECDWSQLEEEYIKELEKNTEIEKINPQMLKSIIFKEITYVDKAKKMRISWSKNEEWSFKIPKKLPNNIKQFIFSLNTYIWDLINKLEENQFNEVQEWWYRFLNTSYYSLLNWEFELNNDLLERLVEIYEQLTDKQKNLLKMKQVLIEKI